jgi:hypothetical protein
MTGLAVPPAGRNGAGADQRQPGAACVRYPPIRGIVGRTVVHQRVGGQQCQAGRQRLDREGVNQLGFDRVEEDVFANPHGPDREPHAEFGLLGLPPFRPCLPDGKPVPEQWAAEKGRGGQTVLQNLAERTCQERIEGADDV